GVNSNPQTPKPLSDTWRVTTDIQGIPAPWTKVDATTQSRYGHVAAYDTATRRMIVFGGADTINGAQKNDTVILTNANGLGGSPVWQPLSPTGTPPSARYGSAATYDATANRLVVFGGRNGTTPLNDLWVLDRANGSGTPPAWIPITPNG